MEERGLALVDPEAHTQTLLPISFQKVIRNPHSKARGAPKANVPVPSPRRLVVQLL